MTGLEEDSQLIRDLVEWTGLKVSPIAKSIGVANTTLNRHFNGTAVTRLGRGTIEKLKQKYPDYPGFKVESDLPPTVTPADRDGESVVLLKEVDLGLSMGDGTEIDHYREEGWVRFDAGLIRSVSRARLDQLFVARGDGDSMFPTLLSGDRVIIDTSQKALNLTDRIWAVSIYGAGGIKRLRTVSKTEVEVISDNPAQDNQIVRRDDLHIIGRVVWLCRDM